MIDRLALRNFLMFTGRKSTFPNEDELREKSERLNRLNIELSLDQKEPVLMDFESDQSENVSVQESRDQAR